MRPRSTVFVLLLASFLGGARPAQEATPPSVIVILADQLRRVALGCYGHPLVDTPHIDGLAAEGLRFDRAYSSSPKCEPFRLSLLTGRWAHLEGAALEPEDVTLPMLLSPTHDCAWFGKAHWIPTSAEQGGWVPPEYRVGWKRFLGFDDPLVLHKYLNSTYFLDNDPTPLLLPGYQPEGQALQLVRFLQTRATSGRPFFAVLSFGPPHNPYIPPFQYDIYSASQVTVRANVPPSYVAMAAGEEAKYLGLVYSLDVQVGVILSALEALALDDNTYVIVTSDHGDTLWSHGLRLKQNPYEESIGTPLILWGPGIEPEVSDRLVRTVDLLPTILGLCDVPVPSHAQGLDVLDSEPPDFAYLEMDIVNNATWLDGRWRGGVRNDGVKYATGSDVGAPLLFLPGDEFELNNVAADPAYAALREEMHRRCVSFAAATGDTFFDP